MEGDLHEVDKGVEIVTLMSNQLQHFNSNPEKTVDNDEYCYCNKLMLLPQKPLAFIWGEKK